MTEEFKSGFACFVGRPNVGKSTLTNALVGEKIAITADQPETTRHPIRGIVHRRDSQVIVVDTPGLHRPRTLLGERLNDLVRETLLEVDVIGFCLPADQRPGPGDAFIARELTELQRVRRTPVVAIATKSDRVDRARLAEHLIAAGVEQGLSAADARELVVGTIRGAAGMLQHQGDVSPAELRRRVTSPNGTTERSIRAFADARFDETVKAAVQANIDRAAELAAESAQPADTEA